MFTSPDGGGGGARARARGEGRGDRDQGGSERARTPPAGERAARTRDAQRHEEADEGDTEATEAAHDEGR